MYQEVPKVMLYTAQNSYPWSAFLWTEIDLTIIKLRGLIRLIKSMLDVSCSSCFRPHESYNWY